MNAVDFLVMIGICAILFLGCTHQREEKCINGMLYYRYEKTRPFIQDGVNEFVTKCVDP